MAKIVYPLLQVLEVKKKRVEDAEKVVGQKKEALAREEEKLKKCEEERDKVKKHKDEKLFQLRAELDQGTTSPKVQQMKAYIDTVKEKLVVENKKVEDQKKQVQNAEKELEEARIELKKRRDEVEKIEMHQKDWEKEALREQEIQEQRDMDELGSQMFLVNRQKYNKGGP